MPQTYKPGRIASSSQGHPACWTDQLSLWEECPAVSHRDLTCSDLSNKCSSTLTRRCRNEDLLVQEISFWTWKRNVHVTCDLTCTHPSLPLSPFAALTQPSDLHNSSVIQNSFLLNFAHQTSSKTLHRLFFAGTMHKTVPLALPHGAVMYETPESFPVFLFLSTFLVNFCKNLCTNC